MKITEVTGFRCSLCKKNKRITESAFGLKMYPKNICTDKPIGEYVEMELDVCTDCIRKIKDSDKVADPIAFFEITADQAICEADPMPFEDDGISEELPEAEETMPDLPNDENHGESEQSSSIVDAWKVTCKSGVVTVPKVKFAKAVVAEKTNKELVSMFGLDNTRQVAVLKQNAEKCGILLKYEVE